MICQLLRFFDLLPYPFKNKVLLVDSQRNGNVFEHFSPTLLEIDSVSINPYLHLVQYLNELTCNDGYLLFVYFST